MTEQHNAYLATGTAPHEDCDFIAYSGDKKTWAPRWGFATTTKSLGTSVKGDTEVFPRGDNPMFRFGGSFGGWRYGAAAYGGDPDDKGNVGPAVNDYSSFAGVFGTGVYVAGVAGTSTNNVGVYGQLGEEDPRDPRLMIPRGFMAGVFGAALEQPGVLGWSSGGAAGCYGLSDYGNGVLGQSGYPGPAPGDFPIAGVLGTSAPNVGVLGTSTQFVGVAGISDASYGVYGRSNKNYAGFIEGDLFVRKAIFAGTKDAIVPFPDGSMRLLHCMESPEHWFEDFGAAKLRRGRAMVKLDVDFAKVIKRGDYKVFLTPEGDCRGLYVRKSAAGFEVREFAGGKSSVAFSYRIVGRRKDIKGHQRFAKIDVPLPPPTRAARRTPRKLRPTAAELRAFVARVEKEARERAPKGAEKARARMRRRISSK
jgi:hypothetical protein